MQNADDIWRDRTSVNSVDQRGQTLRPIQCLNSEF